MDRKIPHAWKYHMRKLLEFVQENRARFEIQRDNAFAMAWGKVFRRGEFLEVIKLRHAEASAGFIEMTNRQRELTPVGQGTVSPELAAVMQRGSAFAKIVHLDNESFYHFAKVVLDDVARAIEFTFETERGISLRSHDKWVKQANAYCIAKGLDLSQELLRRMADMKGRICDVRDKQLAHEQSPRTMSGTAFVPGKGARILATQLYPRGNDPKQWDAETPDDLLDALYDYLNAVADFLVLNRERMKGAARKPISPPAD